MAATVLNTTRQLAKAAAADARRKLWAAERALKVKQAFDDLIAFTEITMPHPREPDDPSLSRYSAQYFHRTLAAALQEVEAGRMPRLIITFPPRHGKSELTSKRLPAWFIGRDPYRSLILGTYNQPFAETWGKKVREVIKSDAFAQVFPGVELEKGSEASHSMKTTEGGELAFVGRGGSATGRGGDLLIIDDPMKDRDEANSDAVRKEVWDWFNDTISTRLMSDTGSIVIIMTRWHEDDLVGRLTDPTNPCFNEEEAGQWKILNIPALAEENDVLGRQPGEALWPEKFGVKFLEGFRRRNPTGFASLYQQRPTPEDGDLIRKDMIITYEPQDIAGKRLRMYAASDHAVGLKQRNDPSCLIVIGIDEWDVIYVLDVVWGKIETDKIVEKMIDLMDRHRPLIWWAEHGHISKSIGPFLKKRMGERGVYTNIVESPVAADKPTRAQSIIGRMGNGKVRFPKHAPWLENARGEMLKFPQGRHDDFVDALAHIGLGLRRQVAGRSGDEERKARQPLPGSFAYMKKASAHARGRSSTPLNRLLRGQ